MGSPALERARELLAWEAPLGLVSIYLEIDPGNRGGGWRAQLGNGLERLRELAADAEHGRKLALRATADRIAAHFDAVEPPFAPGEAGFVEVSERAGRELWLPFQLAPRAAEAVTLGPEPVLAPLLDLLCRSGRRAVALVSVERVRLLDWAPGELEEVEDWKLGLFSDDSRERKAQRPADRAPGSTAPAPPATTSSISASTPIASASWSSAATSPPSAAGSVASLTSSPSARRPTSGASARGSAASRPASSSAPSAT